MIDVEVVSSLAAPEVVSLFIRVTVVLGCTWLLARLAQRRSAAVRHGIWAAGMTAALCVPAGRVFLPEISVEIPSVPGASLVAIERAPDAGIVEEARGTPGLAVGGGSEVFMASSGADVGVPDSGGSTDPDWGAIFLQVWLAGVVLRLTWMTVLTVRTRALPRISRPADRRLRHLLRDVAAELRLRRRVRLVIAPAVSMPVTWGVFRPVVAFPEGAERWPLERARVALLHELAHVRRYDYLTSTIAELACAVYWPLPLVWIARTRLRAEQERSCDDRVLASGTPSVSYAEHLLAVAREFYGRGGDLGIAVAMAREVSLKARVRAILDDRMDRRPFRGAGWFQAVLVTAGIAVPVSAMQARTSSLPPDNAIESVGQEAVMIALPVTSDFRSVPPLAAPPSYVWVEAEMGTANGSTFVREDLDASGAAYAVIRGDDNGDSEVAGALSFMIRVDAPDEYVLWAREVSDRGDRLYIRLDDGPEHIWSLSDSRRDREWEWSVVSVGSTSDDDPTPLRFVLTEGEHVLHIRGGADPVRIDRLLLTNDAAYTPDGRGASLAMTPTTHHFVEAERAQLSGRIRQRRDDDASGGEFLAFRSGRGSEDDGSATFEFTVEYAGRYLFWGRVLGPDGDANSFHVSLNGGDEVIWDVPRRRSDRDRDGWSWVPLNARDVGGRTVDPMVLDLTTGTHSIRVRTRESGTRLDAVLLTNDLTRRPLDILEAFPPTPPPAGEADRDRS